MDVITGTILLFTLCGTPQYLVISDSTGSIDGSPTRIAKVLPGKVFKTMLDSPDYKKKVIKLDEVTGLICA